MRTAYTISAIGHAAVLLWSVLSLGAKPLALPPSEALPVDVVSVSDLTQMTAGSKDAPKVETQKPLVEKVAEAKPVEDPTAKVVENKEVKAAHDTAPILLTCARGDERHGHIRRLTEALLAQRTA